ncbi:MAG: hypothetical protein KF683_04960 [Rubrivivax sp.]|nr:hypothetical protein [Rubrivivax sp.]
MSRALDALIVARLHERRGQWVRVAELAAELRLDAQIVADRLLKAAPWFDLVLGTQDDQVVEAMALPKQPQH